MLEMEGVNAYGIWDYSDWNTLADQLKKSFDYGKQRCTAYVRYVVEPASTGVAKVLRELAG